MNTFMYLFTIIPPPLTLANVQKERQYTLCLRPTVLPVAMDTLQKGLAFRYSFSASLPLIQTLLTYQNAALGRKPHENRFSQRISGIPTFDSRWKYHEDSLSCGTLAHSVQSCLRNQSVGGGTQTHHQFITTFPNLKI